MSKLTATFLYSGMPDYWGGNGQRWDDDSGCLFAYYGTNTTVRDIVDQLVDDFNAGGDADSMHADITGDDVRAALMDMLSAAGRADYESGALSEFAIEFAEANDFTMCLECEESLGASHSGGCGKRVIGCNRVVEDDCIDEDGESPFIVILLESEICASCGAWDEHSVDDICDKCEEKGDDPDRWQCATCDESAAMFPDDYMEVGIPYCAECDKEMDRIEECPYCHRNCTNENGCDGYIGDIDGLLAKSQK